MTSIVGRKWSLVAFGMIASCAASAATADPLAFVTAGAVDTVNPVNIATGGGTAAITLLPVNSSGLNGINLTGNGTTTSGDTAGQTDEIILREDALTNDGTFEGNLGLNWNFTISSSGDYIGPLGWELEFLFNFDYATGAGVFERDGTTSGGVSTTITGDGLYNDNSIYNLHDYTVLLSVYESASGPTVDIPSPSTTLNVDVSSIQIYGDSVVPDPTSSWSGMIMLGGIILSRYFARRKPALCVPRLPSQQ